MGEKRLTFLTDQMDFVSVLCPCLIVSFTAIMFILLVMMEAVGQWFQRQLGEKVE